MILYYNRRLNRSRAENTVTKSKRSNLRAGATLERIDLYRTETSIQG